MTDATETELTSLPHLATSSDAWETFRRLVASLNDYCVQFVMRDGTQREGLVEGVNDAEGMRVATIVYRPTDEGVPTGEPITTVSVDDVRTIYVW